MTNTFVFYSKIFALLLGTSGALRHQFFHREPREDLDLDGLEIIKELAAEIIIVLLFLHYLRSRDKLYATSLTEMTQLFTKTATEGHDVAATLAEALSELRVEIARSNGKKDRNG